MNPNLVREQLAEMLGKSVKTVARALDSLKKKGRIVRVGADKNGHWNFREEAAMASEARSFDPTVLCKNLRWLRANASLSQAAVARELGVSQNSVWKYESGQAEPSIRVLVWYSDRFSVSLDQLLYEDLASRISKKK